MRRKQIQLTRDNIRLSLVHQVYQKEILKKEITVQKWFKRDGIVSVEEYVTAENKIAKSRSIVTDKYTGRSYATFHSPDEIMKHTYPEPVVTGFKTN